MAEAIMNAGSMPPQLPPGATTSGAGGAMPMTAGMPGLPAGVPQSAPATGALALRNKVDEFLKQPTVRRALPPMLILLILAIAVALFIG